MSHAPLEPRQPVPYAPQPMPAPAYGYADHTAHPQGGDDDLELWFVKDFRAIVRRRWPMLILFPLALATLTLAICFVIKPQYKADATVLIQSPQQSSALSALGSSTVGAGLAMLGLPSGANDIATQIEVMESDVILQTVINRLHLQTTPFALRKKLSLAPDKNSTLVIDVSATASTAKTAQAIVNNIVEVYKENMTSEDATVAGHSALLVRAQIADQQEKLRVAEDKLTSYSSRTGTVAPDADNLKRIEMLHTLETDYLEAQQKYAVAKAESEYYSSQAATMPTGIMQSLRFSANPRIDAAKEKLNDLEAERASLARLYTPKDEAMISNRTAIDTIKQQIVDERTSPGNQAGVVLSGADKQAPTPGFVVDQGTSELNPAKQDLSEKIIGAKAAMEAQQSDTSALKAAIDQAHSDFKSVPSITRRMADLRDDVAVAQRIYDELRIQLANLEAERGSNQVYVKMLLPPLLPQKPAYPRPLLFTLCSIPAGIFLAILAMILTEAGNKRIRGHYDIEHDLSLSVIATIPQIGRNRGAERVISIGASAPEIRRLASTLVYLGVGKNIRSLMITSAAPREGVSFIASELALALSQEGQRVILVDANLKSPTLHTYFGLANSSGLAGAMRNGAHPDKALVPLKDSGPLQIVPGGDLENESVGQVLNPEKLGVLLSALQERADIVLLDAPSIFQGIETAILGDKVDASLLVAGIDVAAREDVRRGVSLLSRCKSPILGTVVNEGASRKTRAQGRKGH